MAAGPAPQSVSLTQSPVQPTVEGKKNVGKLGISGLTRRSVHENVRQARERVLGLSRRFMRKQALQTLDRSDADQVAIGLDAKRTQLA